MIRGAKLCTSVLICLAFLLPGYAGFCAPVSRSDTQKGWIITQAHYVYGETVLYVLPNALKVLNKKFNFVAVARAPQWKLCVYNPSKQLMHETTLEDWSRHGVLDNGARVDVLDF